MEKMGTAKCVKCDFEKICPKTKQDFRPGATIPPKLHLMGTEEWIRAISLYEN